MDGVDIRKSTQKSTASIVRKISNRLKAVLALSKKHQQQKP